MQLRKLLNDGEILDIYKERMIQLEDGDDAE